MGREMVKFSIRMDDNLKTRIELLAKKNNFNFTKMLNYIAELGYQTYTTRFDKYYEKQDKHLKKEVIENDKEKRLFDYIRRIINNQKFVAFIIDKDGDGNFRINNLESVEDEKIDS